MLIDERTRELFRTIGHPIRTGVMSGDIIYLEVSGLGQGGRPARFKVHRSRLDRTLALALKEVLWQE